VVLAATGVLAVEHQMVLAATGVLAVEHQMVLAVEHPVVLAATGVLAVASAPRLTRHLPSQWATSNLPILQLVYFSEHITSTSRLSTLMNYNKQQCNPACVDHLLCPGKSRLNNHLVLHERKMRHIFLR